MPKPTNKRELLSEIQRERGKLETIPNKYKNKEALFGLVSNMSDKELYSKGVYPFTKSTNLAAYINSSTAAHYRSAAKHIRKWSKTL